MADFKATLTLPSYQSYPRKSSDPPPSPNIFIHACIGKLYNDQIGVKGINGSLLWLKVFWSLSLSSWVIFRNNPIFILFYFHLDDNKIDQILQETKRNQQMSNQISSRTFITNAFDEGVLPVGQEVSETFFP